MLRVKGHMVGWISGNRTRDRSKAPHKDLRGPPSDRNKRGSIIARCATRGTTGIRHDMLRRGARTSA